MTQQHTDGVRASAPTERAYAELNAAWLAMDGTPEAVKRMNLALGMLGVAIGARVVDSPDGAQR
jgi:hypothetical protein